MADGDVVKMKLTFWRSQQPPGTIVEVPADEVHRWKGFAVQVGESYPSGETTAPATVDGGKPAETAKVADWRAYAVQRGYDEIKVSDATKQELIDWVAKVDSQTAAA